MSPEEGRRKGTITAIASLAAFVLCQWPSSSGAVEAALQSTIQTAETAKAILLRPGDDVEAIVDAAPGEATFVFAEGLYREVTLHPKDGQTFIGEGDVVLSGARIFTGWVKDGRHWRLAGLPPPLPIEIHGRPERYGEPHVLAREMLFLDGELLQPVASLDDLGPGRWYRDGNSAVIAEDPAGQLTEIAVTGEGFSSNETVSKLTIRNLTLEKYAVATRRGAIQGRINNNESHSSWRIENVTSRYNHGAGLVTGDDFVVMGGHFTHNGQAGILNYGARYRIEGAEIAYNNILHHFPGWEAGGFKTRASEGGTLRGNDVHHNFGHGLWTDGSEINPTMVNNYVHDNDGAGIHFELTFGGRIEENRIERNGQKAKKWKTSGPNIYINHSSDIIVTNNEIVVAAEGHGKGIILQQRRRGNGKWQTLGNRIMANRITYEGDGGYTGWWIDEADEWYKDNLFDGNFYFGIAHAKRFMIDGEFVGLDSFRQAGQEANGRWEQN